MNNNILTYPDDGDELISMYLPGGEESPQMKELRILETCIQNTLDRNHPRFSELDRLPHNEVYSRLIQMRKQIFHLSFQALIFRAWRQQCEICEQNFRDTPAGKEAPWIAESRPPEIYEKGEYDRLEAWWTGLAQKQQLEILHEHAELFEGCNDEQLLRGHCIGSFWEKLPVENKEELHAAYA